MKIKFTSNIKSLMKERGLTIEQVVKTEGLSRATLHKLRLDEGIAECRLSTLARIAGALDVSTKDLYEEGRE